jgi:hypothetical protein
VTRAFMVPRAKFVKLLLARLCFKAKKGNKFLKDQNKKTNKNYRDI